MKRTLLLVLAVSLVAVPTAAAKKPPSFALWSARESNHQDSVLNPLEEGCKKLGDSKGGACLAKGLMIEYPKLDAHWSAGLARIARPQTAACKKAIHAYYLASTKERTAMELYMKAHQHARWSQILSDLNDEPYATLGQVTDEQKSRAIRVCG
jgi:hypothetical protein